MDVGAARWRVASASHKTMTQVSICDRTRHVRERESARIRGCEWTDSVKTDKVSVRLLSSHHWRTFASVMAGPGPVSPRAGMRGKKRIRGSAGTRARANQIKSRPSTKTRQKEKDDRRER